MASLHEIMRSVAYGTMGLLHDEIMRSITCGTMASLHEIMRSVRYETMAHCMRSWDQLHVERWRHRMRSVTCGKMASLHEIMRSVTCGTMASLHEISYIWNNGVNA